jgi:DNA invertase Pin-like site-specific DNA recombinase
VVLVRIAGYLRVSTDLQAEKGYGLTVQRSEITSWAKARGHRIALWATDEGVSGTSELDARDGLLEAVAAVRSGEVQGIAVYKLDRLARDLMVQETILADVRKAGGEVFSTMAGEAAYLGDDPNDPTRKLIRQVLGAVAEYERALVRLRLRSGKMAKRAKGGYIGGTVPYGFRIADDGTVIADDHEQATIARARSLHAEGFSLRAIGTRLKAEGMHPRKAEAEWMPSTVRTLVTAPA